MNTLIDEILIRAGLYRGIHRIGLDTTVGADRFDPKNPRSYINRMHKQDTFTEAKSELLKAILEVVGDDEEIPIENRMSDIEQVRLFNQVSKAVYGRNALKAELRTKFKELFKDK